MSPPAADLQSNVPGSVTRSLRAARGGSFDALGEMFERCRDYLLLIANQELAGDLHAKVAPSDLVQETFLEAHQEFGQFTGSSEAELRAWLRQILLNNVRDAIRRYRSVGKREVSRERRLLSRDRRSIAPGASDDTPSGPVRFREEHVRLRNALARLSADHRRVITLRNLDLKSFAEIGRLLDRTPEAARKLWGRAILELERRLGGADAR